MRKLNKIDLYIIPLLFVLPAAVILRTFALFTSFNSITMHFDEKIAITVGSILVAVATVGFLSYLFLGEKEQNLIARNDNAASYIPAGIVSTALLFIGVHSIKMAFGGYPEGIISTLSLICGVLAFVSVGSFFLSVFIERNDNLYKAAFNLCIVFFLAIYAALLYFDKAEHPTNSPNRFIDELAFLSSSIFFLYEARIPLGRAKWRGYVSFGLVATLLCAYSSIPALILYIANDYLISESLFENMLSLALMLFILSKVLQTKKLTVDSECDTAKSICMLAAMREKEMEERKSSSHAHVIDEKEENTAEDNTEDSENYTFDISPIEPTDNSESEE